MDTNKTCERDPQRARTLIWNAIEELGEAVGDMPDTASRNRLDLIASDLVFEAANISAVLDAEDAKIDESEARSDFDDFMMSRFCEGR